MRKRLGSIFTRWSMSGSWPHSVQPPHNPSPKEALEADQADYVDIIKLVEDDETEEEKQSRAAEFELRAKNMDITEAKLVAQKVAIWEGMFAAKQNGDDIGVSTLYSALFWRL